LTKLYEQAVNFLEDYEAKYKENFIFLFGQLGDVKLRFGDVAVKFD